MTTPITGQYLPGEDITPHNINQIREQIHEELQSKESNPSSSYKTASPNLQDLNKEVNVSYKKSVEDTKRIIDTFREKTAKYPKHISYEGSMVLCVLLSMKKVAVVSMNGLPSIDQELIRS